MSRIGRQSGQFPFYHRIRDDSGTYITCFDKVQIMPIPLDYRNDYSTETSRNILTDDGSRLLICFPS